MLYERFVKALEAGKAKGAQVQLGFHGTVPQNIDPILQHGLDPVRVGPCPADACSGVSDNFNGGWTCSMGQARRNGQAKGPGEYFGRKAQAASPQRALSLK